MFNSFKIIENIKSLTKTLFYFSVACSLIPFLMVHFICVKISNKLWIYCLSKKYNSIYEFSKSKKIRSLIDTTRNAAIFHFLLDINGVCDYNKIKEYYINYLINKRNKIDELYYPKLRKKLISCWGQYAWVKDDSDFNVDNHIVLNTKQYRGRPVTENNIQEFVSDLITKYLPPEIPPWQVIIIPILPTAASSTTATTTSSSVSEVDRTVTNIETEINVQDTDDTESSSSSSTSIGEREPTPPTIQIKNEKNQDEKYYILIRIHHLLLADENNLHNSELLMLNTDKSNSLTIKSGIHDVINDPTIDNKGDDNDDELSSKFSDFIKKPKHIPNLWNHIMITASNRWNEFIYHYDPLESPDVDKKQQIKCLSQLISILFITFVTIINDFIKDYQKTNNQIKYKLKYFINLCKREIYKRNITIQVMFNAILTTMNPFNICKNFIYFFWWITITFVILWPYYVYCELLALKELILTGQTNSSSSNTFTALIAVYFPLIMNALIEFYDIIYEIIKTPRNIYEEFFVNSSKEGNILQIKSYCGRKVISFSKSIDMLTIRKKLNKFNNTNTNINLNLKNSNNIDTSSDLLDSDIRIDENEYLLSCLCTSLYTYLKEYRDHHRIPKQLNVTLRSINKKYFFEKYNKTAHIGGVLFLQLPLCENVNKKQINFIKNMIKRIHDKQKIIYLLSLAQLKYELLTKIIPQVWMKIFINHFSINFPVTITEIYGNTMNNIEVNWGHRLNDLLFFRPPQSKTCLSLNLHRFGNRSRLTVMADTQLAPDYIKISTNWENYVENTNLSI